MKQFEFSTLHVFVAIAETGSLSGAARRVNLAVSAVSKRLLDLENYSGTTLFDRHGRGVSLTPAGRSLLVHARDLLLRVDMLRADLSEFAKGSRGVVRLAANESVITQFLPDDLPAFLRQHPGIAVTVTELQSEGVVAAVLEGRCDLGIFVDGAVGQLGLATFPYRGDELCVVLPHRHPLARRRSARFEELLEHDFVAQERSSSISQLLVAKGVSRLRFRVQVRSFHSVCRMVEANLGLAILPRNVAALHARSMELTVIGLREAWASRQHLIGVRAVDALAHPARVLLQDLRAGGASTSV